MLTIPRQQTFQRWDNMPENLREALVSEENGQMLWQTCEAEHIPEDKIHIISRLTGYVVMGFIHPEDLADEMKKSLGLDPQMATSVANSLIRKIVVPIKSDVDKIYAPVPTGPIQAPRLLEEIKFPGGAPKPSGVIPPPANLDKVPLGEIRSSVNEPPLTGQAGQAKISPLNFSRTPMLPSTPPPASPTSLGGPPLKPTAPGAPPTPFATKPTPTPPPGASSIYPEAKIFSASTGMPPASSPETKTSGASVSPPSGPAPVMLHEEGGPAPVKAAPEFHLNVTPILSNKSSSSPEMKPAHLELGGIQPKKEPPKLASTPASPRVINYSELRTPLTPPSPAMPKPSTPPTGPGESPIMGAHTIISPELKIGRLQVGESVKEQLKPTSPPTAPALPQIAVVQAPTPQPPTPGGTLPSRSAAPPPPGSSGMIRPSTSGAAPASGQPTMVIEIKQTPYNPAQAGSTGQAPINQEKVPAAPSAQMPASTAPSPFSKTSGALIGETVGTTTDRPASHSPATLGMKYPRSGVQEIGPQKVPGFMQQPESAHRGFFGRIFGLITSLFRRKPAAAPFPKKMATLAEPPKPSMSTGTPSPKPTFKPGEEVIDLSSLRIVKANGASNGSSQTQTGAAVTVHELPRSELVPPHPKGPEIEGNTVHL